MRPPGTGYLLVRIGDRILDISLLPRHNTSTVCAHHVGRERGGKASTSQSQDSRGECGGRREEEKDSFSRSYIIRLRLEGKLFQKGCVDRRENRRLRFTTVLGLSKKGRKAHKGSTLVEEEKEGE